QSLLEVLREELTLTGTKEGCNNGNCGACSVILDGVLVNSCLVLAVEVEGKTVTTIEGLAPPEGLHPLQRAFLEDAALQCGFCTPGVIMAAKALLDQHPTPTEREVRYWLAGNLCRCTGYDKIVRAVLAAAAVPNPVPSHALSEANGASEGSVQKNPAPDKAQQKTYRVIGTRPIRHDGTDKVTGRASFGADIQLPAMLYGKVLRSPHAHARIRSIDTSEAEALPGVKAVVTAADLSEGAHNLRYRRNNILARDKVLYHGHAVAAVAATSPHIAEEALALIKVDYEVLPPVLEVRKAMRDDAPILLDGLRTDELGQKGEAATNIANHIQHRRGDVERGFQEAAVIVEREFHTSTVHQGYIEPQSATALYNPDGQLTLWCTTQGAFGVRDQVSDILHIPVSRIRVIPMEIGGGFGGKNNVYLEPVAALLSKKSRHRPVKMVMSRAEVLAATGPTAGSYIRVKMGADESGRITAVQAYLAYEAGAFPGPFPLVGSGASTMFAPYRLENVQIDGYEVVVNKPKAETYRAPGASNAVFAAEVVIDELCEKLGLDPLEFRAINGAQEGDRRPDGPVHPRIGYLETIEAARNHPHYTAPLAGPPLSPPDRGGKRGGRGVA
ncbi:MAG: hypothetical protein FJW34_26875, partial [Acidobacteria bacterium]|nr:hypothetical protein [Acidobacteriota bacterium]